MSTLVDRLEVAKSIRRGLEQWPDENHWCKDRLTDTGPNGEKQVCTFQLLASSTNGGIFGSSPQFQLAQSEVLKAAKETTGKEYLHLCDFNNTNDFATVKSIVEKAAANLERAN